MVLSDIVTSKVKMMFRCYGCGETLRIILDIVIVTSIAIIVLLDNVTSKVKMIVDVDVVGNI